VVLAALVVGVVLRFLTTSHLWLDEALSVDIARLPLADIPGALRHDGHPPLYYALLHGWMQLFGEGDLAVRSLSGACALGALVLAWFAGRQLAGRDGALLAVGLLALSPFAVRYATEARMYALVIVLVLAGYLLMRRALEEPSIGRLVPVALVVGALLLTHYWALWLVAAVVLVLGWQWRRTRGQEHRAVSRVLIAVMAGGVFLLPWLPSMLTQSRHTGTPWAAPVRPTSMLTVSLNDIGGGDYAEAQLLGTVLLGLALLALVARTIDEHRVELDGRTVPGVRRVLAVVGLTLVVASAAGYATGTTFASRYIAAVFPLFLLAATVGLVRIGGQVARGLLLGAVVALGFVGSVHNVVTDRTQAGVIATAIDERRQADDLVVVCPDQLGPAMRRLLPDARLVTYPDLGDGALVNWYDYADRNAAADPPAILDRALATAAPPPRVVWLVASDTYKTLEGQCPAVQAALTARSSDVEAVVAQDGDAYFENAGLFRFVLKPSA
jgi:hypothetical protein